MSWDTYTLAVQIEALRHAGLVQNNALRNLTGANESLVQWATKTEQRINELEARIAELESKNN